MKRRFDVALSYAGEDRDYVEAVAGACKVLGLNVFHDRLMSDEVWGKDLHQHLGAIYEEHAFFVVAFISQNYAAKYWTRQELEAALQADQMRGSEYILPARFDDTPIAALGASRADIDLRVITPEKLASLIALKVEKFHTEDLGIREVVSGFWSNEGNVFPADTHRLELELEPEDELLTGVLRCWGGASDTGVVSIQGRRYKRKLHISVLNASGRGIINIGDAVAELIEGYGDQPTQISWKLQEGDEKLLPKSTILYSGQPE
jgi:hypothetical protein